MAGMPEKIKRNKQIHEKKMEGATYRELSVEYDLSTKRLQDIVTRESINLTKG